MSPICSEPMSIRNRLLLLVLAVWLPAATGFGLLAKYTFDEEMASSRRQVEQYGVAISSLVERELDKRVVLARTLAASNAVRAGDFQTFHQEAKVATFDTDNWALIATANTQLVNTRASYPIVPIPRAKRVALRRDAPYFVFVPRAPVVGTAAISVFVPVPGHESQTYNVGVSFQPSVIQQLLQQAPQRSDALVAIVDADQFIMARSREPERWFGLSVSAVFKQRILNKGHGFAPSLTLDGVESMTYLTPPNAHGWSVVVSTPTSTLDAAAQQAWVKGIGASALLLCIGLAVALLGARRIGGTIATLQHAANELGDNKVPAWTATGVTEVDDVASALRLAAMRAHEANSALERRVEEAVHRAEKAQAQQLHGQKLEAIGRLTAGIAHDFNNLLQTIGTAHHLISRHIIDGPQRRALEGAVRATSKGGDLVKQLTAFGRVQGLEPSRVSLADVVLLGQSLTSTAVGESVVLSAALEPGLPDVYVDPTQLEMALLNLVFNARDSMPSGGHITISARLATAAESAPIGEGKFVRLEVSDDGIGMSESTRARAFEPYFTTKAVGSGTGIGLAQVQSFAKQSGGDITLASQPGRGTEVHLYLPVAFGPLHVPALIEPAAIKGEALYVLMVEDDVLVASITVAALEDEGYTVRLCHSADEALQVLATAETFDLLFTDVVMPGSLNGLDLVRWCQINRPSMPALVTTGYAENLTSVSAAVLRKPYEVDSLLRALQKAVQPKPDLARD